MKSKKKISGSSILRQKAEEHLNKRNSEMKESYTEADLLKLIHELQVHQVELELQNQELIQAKETAEIAVQKYTDLYDFAPNGYFSLTGTGQIIELNLSGARMLGKDRRSLKNSQFSFFLTLESKPIFNLFLEKVFQSNSQETCEIQLLTNDDAPVFLLLTGIVADNHEQCHVTAVDISEIKIAHKALHLSLSKYQTLFSLFPIGITISDTNGKIVETNRIAQRLLGLDLEQQMQRYIDGNEWHIIRPDGTLMPASEYASVRALKEKRQIENIEMGIAVDHGQTTWLNVSATPIPIEGYGVAITYSDLTSRKAVEKELLEAKEHAEESDRLKSAFLANMSHEIRTPMNGILGFAELLKDPEITGDQQRKFIGIIEKSGARMLNIINNIVDISKIEAGLMEVNIKKTNVNEQIGYIYTFFKPAVECKGMSLNYKKSLPDSEAFIETDPEKLYAILTNIVNNALKFTHQGSIELGYEHKGEFLEFFVKDTGMGIAGDRLEAIFERFIQADHCDKHSYEGAGLGLAITKAYVEMLGGKIRVQSQPGTGSEFYFTLPRVTGKETSK